MKFEKELTDFFESKEQTCTIDKKTLIKLSGNQSGYTVVYMVPSDIFAPRHFNLKPVYVLDEYEHREIPGEDVVEYGRDSRYPSRCDLGGVRE